MNFDLGAWVTESLISGVKQGMFAREYAAIKVADYMLKGVLSPEQVEQISVEAVYTPPEIPVAEIPVDLPVEEPIPEEPLMEG